MKSWVKKLANKILMPSHGSISKSYSFTIGCNLHSSPRAWQYKVKVKVFMLTFITSENMNITFKTHLFHEDPLSKSVVQNILLPSISCLVIQGELNRRMSLLLHVQVHNDQIMIMIILLFCKTSVVSSFLQDNCIFQFSFYLQEWVYPVALSLSENYIYFSFHFHFLCRSECTQLHWQKEPPFFLLFSFSSSSFSSLVSCSPSW